VNAYELEKKLDAIWIEKKLDAIWIGNWKLRISIPKYSRNGVSKGE